MESHQDRKGLLSPFSAKTSGTTGGFRARYRWQRAVIIKKRFWWLWVLECRWEKLRFKQEDRDLNVSRNCGQNLNEYVEALITLKQKIINTDNLLTEYQKKCDELQFARRENITLHHQVEQMLQKISPLQKCQEELGSLKAELEEKKSSLKLYQDTHQEYARVKEECLKTDAQKKKLEAKVKKLEEAAVKQTQDFKQLRNEKKILEKEFRKTQEKLDEFSKQKNEKELRHIGTQISSDSYGSIDKRKVKLLLKELWLCINTTHRLPGEGSRCVPEKPAEENPRSSESREDGVPRPAGGSPLRTSAVQTCLAELSMEIEGDFSACEDAGRERPGGAACRDDGVFKEDRNPEAVTQKNEDERADVSDHDHSFDEDLQAAVDFFKLPPPLLSPVPSPPLLSSPHLGAFPSSLSPEIYFGECTDSSDHDSAQRRNSEPVSEDDTPELLDCFSSSGKSKGTGTWEEKLQPHEATQALNTLEVSEVTAVGFGTFTANLREPAATFPSAHEKHWTLSSEFVSKGEEGVLDEAGRQREVREMDGSVQTEKTRPKPTGSGRVEKLSSSLALEEGMALGTSDSCHPPLGPWPSNEPSTPEGKTLVSRVIGSPKLEAAKWTLTGGVTSASGRLSTSGHFQALSGEMEKEREAARGLLSGDPSAPGAAGAALVAAALSLREALSSPVASGASSLCGHPRSPSGLEDDAETSVPTEVGPPELHRLEQASQAATFTMVDVHSEPPECSVGEGQLENSLRALSPVSGASDSHGQRGSEVGCTTLVRGMNDICSLLQSGFLGAAQGGLGERQGPRVELTPSRSDFTSAAGPQSGLIRSGFGFGKSTSWHHSDLLRRRGEERLGPQPEREQEAAASSESRGSASKPEGAGEDNSPAGFRAPASLLPNQVSVITKQARPEAMQDARWQPSRLSRREPPLVTDVDNGAGRTPSGARCGERAHTAPRSREAAATESAAPGLSSPWRKSDFDSPGGSLPVESSHYPTGSTLSFSSDSILVANQDVVTEAAVQEEVQKQSLCLPATNVDTSGLDVEELPGREVTPSRGFPVGDTVRASGEALAVTEDPSVVQHGPKECPQLLSHTPGGASPEALDTTETAFSPVLGSRDEEKHAVPRSSLPGALYCYTGIREAGGGDTEVEEGDAPSCSEGENDPEAGLEDGLQSAGGASGRGVGAASAGAAETRPSVEVGRLTSALRDCSLSALSETDGLSTSEVVMFLESCQLRDYSSGDSVSDCSSKGTLNKGMNKESKQSEPSGEKCRKQLCEEETLETSEECVGSSEEEDCPLRSMGQLAQCSLETLPGVLTRIRQELQAGREDAAGKDAGESQLLSAPDSVTAEREEEQVLPLEAAGSSSPTPTAGADARGRPPSSGGPDRGNTQGRAEGHGDASRPVDAKEEVSSEPPEPSPLCAAPGVGSGEVAFQCQISTVTSEVINVLVNKDQNLVIEKGDNWTIINGVALMPDVDQVILCDAPEDAPVSPDPEGLAAGFIPLPSVEKSPETGHPGPPSQEPQCGSSVAGTQSDISSSGQSTNFDKSRLRNRPVKPSVRISSEIYDQNFETQTVPSDHTYYNSKLEPLSKNKNRSKISNRDQTNKPVKLLASSRAETTQSEVSPSFSGERGNGKTQRSQTQTILASADTSTPADCCADTLSKIRQEVGPPLPPLLAPLIATPPRTSQPASPPTSSSSPSSPVSPGGPVSPPCAIPVSPMVSPLLEEPGHSSPPHASPSPSTAPASDRVLSSPLQFCAATPKHAVPVPGRLPPFASAHPAVAAPQENSVKILDTMYPELSARARTLSILKGNIQLTRGPPADSKNLPGPASAIRGFKAITSSSTAFVKAGGSSGGDCKQDKSRDLGPPQDSGGKRALSAATPRSAKRLRLDSGSPEPEPPSEGVSRSPQRNPSQAAAVRTEEEGRRLPAVGTVSQSPLSAKETVESYDGAVAEALKKIAESSFDLLPVIRSHVYVGNISKKPVMRDQEKEVVYEFSTTKKPLAECLLRSILSELKIQKMSVEHNYIHALCRVYVGICRQLGDLERARLFCYSLLKEDFPESEKLTLFIANMWHDIFISQSVINKAMQLVARQRAKGEVLNCLRAFLNWEKNAPADVGFMVSKLLLTIQLCPKTEFQSSERFGEDLSDNTWEYVCAIDLLCCHQKWIWTHDNIISKELWPVMDKWIKYRKGHANIAYTPDIIIASILRLIGRLGQLGLKEGFPSAVKNISAVIGMFIQHAQDEVVATRPVGRRIPKEEETLIVLVLAFCLRNCRYYLHAALCPPTSDSTSAACRGPAEVVS
ncbi:little elongation complex subunit 1 isoform X2 [Physeter macrocephalus]|uniref:Little elongation complex subunit 1 isoform X2 n=1 Tax=Physeter macrocephalus TaxID=9755 RepID=A0A2Y9FM33_PHYMC|nr:little elongation complex subunit 1 isoform X2 [Physeter catodon]|eukprot:XP_007125259.2 little elongation complex subunit 1 isoform X2 [Physeter catodon]